MMLLIVIFVFALCACDDGDISDPEPQIPEPETKEEFLFDNYRMSFETTVLSVPVRLYSWCSEELTYSYELDEEDEKVDESFEVKIEDKWYLYKQNSFGYWTSSITDDPYEEGEIDIADFDLDESGYYAVKSDKLAYYSDLYMDIEGVEISAMRVKLNAGEMPTEMLLTMYFVDYDISQTGKIIVEYDVEEEYELPEEFVDSHNLRVIRSGSIGTSYYGVYENVAFAYFIRNGGTGLPESVSMEIDAYGVWINAYLDNGQWKYFTHPEPYSKGFNMLKVLDYIDFDDFVPVGDSLFLKAAKLKEYAPIVIYNANPSAIVMTELKIKTSEGKVAEMSYTCHFEEGYDIITEPDTFVYKFEHGVLTLEDLP